MDRERGVVPRRISRPHSLHKLVCAAVTKGRERSGEQNCKWRDGACVSVVVADYPIYKGFLRDETEGS